MSLAVSASLVCASFALPGCATEDDGPENIETRAYSGEEIFLAIFFAQGDAAERLPITADRQTAEQSVRDFTEEEWDIHAAAAADVLRDNGLDDMADTLETSTREELLSSGTPELGDFPGLMVELIDAKDPTFFDRFATEVTSGDHYRVAAAVGESGKLLLAAMGEMNSPVGGDQGAGQGFCILVWGGAVLFAAAVVVVVAAGNVVVNANAVTTMDCWTCAGTEDGLRGQVMVDEITVAFGEV
ncbi:MAG: hypothetical protein K0V04_42270 [Deltaproteobacteria bacterium]|nr:hypothetical protein [Deltaproteobacteria bacterium]